MTKIIFDMNQSEFQQSLFKLEKQEQRALLNTLNKISQLKWSEMYADKGINWESIKSNKVENELYSFRFSQKYRGTAYREGDYMVLVGLFPDHDGAYK